MSSLPLTVWLRAAPASGQAAASERAPVSARAGAGEPRTRATAPEPRIRTAPAPGIVIRAEPFDAADAISLRAELEAELWERYGGEAEPGPRPTAQDTPVFLIARDAQGRPLGCGSLRWLSRHTVEIKRMFVRPSARRQGIASHMLEALEDHALILGARRTVLETGPLQPESLRLYESRGYRRIRRFGPYAGSRRSYCYARTLWE